MKQNAPITVECVDNGFIVREAPNHLDRNAITSECLVFETRSNLINYLEMHFSIPLPAKPGDS